MFSSKNLTIIFGAMFVLVGLLGFVPNQWYQRMASLKSMPCIILCIFLPAPRFYSVGWF